MSVSRLEMWCRHCEVAREVLGSDTIYVECEEAVYRYLRDVVFTPCYAVEGGITILERGSNWLDLRVVRYRTEDLGWFRVTRAVLGVRVAYNYPETIMTEETREACRRFREVLTRYSTYFVSGELRDVLPRFTEPLHLTEEDLRKQVEEVLRDLRRRVPMRCVVEELQRRIRELSDVVRTTVRRYCERYLFSFRKSTRELRDAVLSGDDSAVWTLLHHVRSIVEYGLGPRNVPRYVQELYREVKPVLEELRKVERELAEMHYSTDPRVLTYLQYLRERKLISEEELREVEEGLKLLRGVQ